MRRLLAVVAVLALAGCHDHPTPTPSPSPSPSASPSPSPSTSPSPSPSSSPSASPSPSPSPAGWPNPANTGVRVTTLTDRSASLTVTQPGAVVEGLRLTGGAGITVNAPGVVIRDVELNGGKIVANSTGLRIEYVTIRGNNSSQRDGVIGPCGYTAVRVQINGPQEGFRVGANCGPVVIQDSFVRVGSPTPCGDWHGDGLQAYGAGASTTLTVRNTVIHLDEGNCGGTAPFFAPRGSNQGNSNRVDIDGLLVVGGGFSFRLGMPGSVKGLLIAQDRWGYGPVDVFCDAVPTFDAKTVTVASVGAAGAYQPTGGTPVTCTGDGT